MYEEQIWSLTDCVAFPDWIDPYFVGSVNPEGIPRNTQTHSSSNKHSTNELTQ
jgi:hypothetical protein